MALSHGATSRRLTYWLRFMLFVWKLDISSLAVIQIHYLTDCSKLICTYKS
jgi:hypothetical protein